MEVKYYEVSLEAVAKRLKEALEGLPDLLIAVLYGSILRRSLVRDVDVAVYFRWEEGLEGIVKLAGALEDKLKLPVDVVPLRWLPPKLKLKVLLDGVKLVVRDNQLYWLLVSQAFSEASDMELKYRYAVQRT